jgi:hypothetical protein
MYFAAFWLFILAFMGFWCDFHWLTFGTHSAWSNHRQLHHNRPSTPSDSARIHNFTHLDGTSYLVWCLSYADKYLAARLCGPNGERLPHGTPPSPRDDTHDWTPFSDLWSFNFADYKFVKCGSLAVDINQAMQNWAKRSMAMSGVDSSPFRNHADMLRAIDAIKAGQASWGLFDAGYTGHINDTSPGYLRDRWTVHTCDMRKAAHMLMANPEYDGHFDYTARQEFVPAPDQPGVWQRQFSDVMSGEWAWNESVSWPDMMPIVF